MKQILGLGSIVLLTLALALPIGNAKSGERHYRTDPPQATGNIRRLKRLYLWGPAKMPPAPTDFGPYFDYPPESLNSTPTHDPYPN